MRATKFLTVLIRTGCCLGFLLAGHAIFVGCQDGNEPVTSDQISGDPATSALDQTSVAGVITAFVNDVIVSAPAGDDEGLAAARALSRLPRSEQRRIGDSDTSSAHDGLLDFLRVDSVPDGAPTVQILAEDPLTKRAEARITLAFGSRDEIRILELERTVCLAGNNLISAAKACKQDNLLLYGDEEPWKITAVRIP